jgi:hypothetical protein
LVTRFTKVGEDCLGQVTESRTVRLQSGKERRVKRVVVVGAILLVCVSCSSSSGSGLSKADIAQAVEAVHTNWDKCLSRIGVSSATATVEAIDDSRTGRPIDEGKRPVLVHVKWGAKRATFIVDLEGQLTGAALRGSVANAMVEAAKQVGGDC